MKLDTPLDIVTAPRRNSKRWKPGTVTWGEILSWVDTPADVKECGNYLLGTLRGDTRSKTTIMSRSAITLDIDHPTTDVPTQLELVADHAALIHTTHSSSPDDLRYRVIIPASRSLAPDEYYVVAELLMDRYGREQFDPGTSQPERYMFMPAAQQPEWFGAWVLDGPALDVDALLAGWDPDLSQVAAPKPHPNKRDPLTLDGVVGAFNRVYTIEEVIYAYDIPYEPAGDRRWHLVGARSEAGISEVSDNLVYSHHVNDPAVGQTCSAFDLVRLHRFHELDDNVADKTPVNRRPSHTAMLELASIDPKVVGELVGVDFTQDMADQGLTDWRLGIKLHPRTGEFLDTIDNWDLVRANEPVFKALYYNEMTLTVEVDTDLPWRTLADGGETFTSTDRAALCHHLERQFKIRPARSFMDELVDTSARARLHHPVRQYLGDLVWDGTPRVETCLPGVRPTPYTRMVARKSMVAAVARIMDPGCKWDHTLVIFGPEGLGKSWWIEKMARGHSASLGRIGDKDTLLIMRRSWIMLADESGSLRKADADTMKEFLTRNADVFRLPYERESLAHKRHCVIWGTTNDEVFLRRQEGNRRFLIVRSEDKVDFSSLTDHYIDQVWAEAMALYLGGEQLFLEVEEGAMAAAEREHFTEEDALAGVLDAFLNTLVPANWSEMSPDARRLWMTNHADGLVKGTEQQTETCSSQLWVEALGRRIGDHRRADLLDINTALKRLPGWAPVPGRHRVPHYGPQQVFRRVPEEEDLI